MNERAYDIVIIGSGAGGGTVAQELSPLCREGLRIAVLEKGPKLRDDEFTGREFEMARALYDEGGGFLTADATMTLAFCSAYGGSTAVYTGTSLLPPERVIRGWNVPGLTLAEIERRAQKFKSQNNVHLLEDDVINENNKLFVEGCRKLGWHAGQFPVNVKGCRGSSLCNLGCPNGAKMGTHRVQLPEAERNGVTVVTNCTVHRIDDRAIHATVEENRIGYPSAWEAGEYTVRARAVVLAAGAVNTPAILLRSGLERALPALGRYFTCHPALILVAQHPRPITNYVGHPKSYYCDHFTESDGFLLETCMYFPFTTAKSLAGFGEDVRGLMSSMDRSTPRRERSCTTCSPMIAGSTTCPSFTVCSATTAAGKSSEKLCIMVMR